MNSEKDGCQLIRDLMLENQKLISENNQLLKKIRRDTIIGFWVKIVGFFILIGAPVAIYYYLIQPYFNSVNSSFQSFGSGLQDVPGWQQFRDSIQGRGE